MKDLFNCRECVDLLLDYVEGTLDDDLRASLEEHMSACPPCLHFLKSYRCCSEAARKLRDQEVQVPSELKNRLKSFLREQVRRAGG